MLKNTLFAFTTFFIAILPAIGQSTIEQHFSNVVIKIDTALFSWKKDRLMNLQSSLSQRRLVFQIVRLIIEPSKSSN